VTDPKHPRPEQSTPGRGDEKPPEGPPVLPKASGLDYVFKIAPADPKNNFDFEDVADK
jgi:hypothetical protein